jgi:hypothetical protein
MILIPFFTIFIVSLSLTNSVAYSQEHTNAQVCADAQTRLLKSIEYISVFTPCHVWVLLQPYGIVHNYSNIPFKLPLPLGDLNSDNIIVSKPSKSKEHDHLNDNPLSNSRFKEGHSVFKATIIVPNNQILKKAGINNSMDSRIEKALPPVNTVKAATNNSNKNINNMQFNNHMYPIAYHITGNGNKLNNISIERDNNTLLLNIASQSNGNLTIQLPRNEIADSKKQGTNSDDTFFAVLEDGKNSTAFDQSKNRNNKMTELTIYFEKGTRQIEVLASHTSGEFDTTFAIAFSLSTVGLIVATFRKHSDLC